MPEITIRLHRDLAECFRITKLDWVQPLAAVWRQAGQAVQSHGPKITYAPALLPNGLQ